MFADSMTLKKKRKQQELSELALALKLNRFNDSKKEEKTAREMKTNG